MLRWDTLCGFPLKMHQTWRDSYAFMWPLAPLSLHCPLQVLQPLSTSHMGCAEMGSAVSQPCLSPLTKSWPFGTDPQGPVSGKDWKCEHRGGDLHPRHPARVSSLRPRVGEAGRQRQSTEHSGQSGALCPVPVGGQGPLLQTPPGGQAAWCLPGGTSHHHLNPGTPGPQLRLPVGTGVGGMCLL